MANLGENLNPNNKDRKGNEWLKASPPRPKAAPMKIPANACPHCLGTGKKKAEPKPLKPERDHNPLGSTPDSRKKTYEDAKKQPPKPKDKESAPRPKGAKNDFNTPVIPHANADKNSMKDQINRRRALISKVKAAKLKEEQDKKKNSKNK